MATASERDGPGLQNARTKLDGLLKELAEKNEESAEDESIKLESGVLSSMPPPSTPTKRSSGAKTPRKRRKKDAGYDADGGEGSRQHSSYVMKLFDRSVDFAQFGEDTQLYILARAWMRNKPFGSKAESQEQGAANSPSSVEGVEGTSAESDVDTNGVYSLPDPLPMKMEVVVPEPVTIPVGHLGIQYECDTMSLSDILNAHQGRWKKVRSNWRQRSWSRQVRYSESIKKIREMYSH